jgi:hypothetical protein
MISIYATKVEAVDEDHNILFTLELLDEAACTIEMKKPMVLSNGNLEEVLEAVRQAVKLLRLE